MKKKKWIKILLIIIGIMIGIFIVGSIFISKISNNMVSLEDSEISFYFNEYEVKTENLSSFVKSTGEIISFTIETLDVPNYAKVTENYVKDGEMVTKKQKILKTNTEGIIKNVTAPISGMYFKVDSGDGTLHQIYDTNDIGIEIAVSEKDIANLQLGQKATVKISALNKEVEGEVTYISKLPDAGKFKARIKINYFDELKFGYGVSVKINISEKENVIVIPYDLLNMDESDKYYVINAKYKNEYYNAFMSDREISNEFRTYVEIGTITNNKVEIISGLNVGDKILELNW